jgi:hypothetical protein
VKKEIRSSNKIKKASEEYIKSALSVLEHYLGREVLDILERKPKNHFSYYHSLFGNPGFWELIGLHEDELQNEKFNRCVELLQKNKKVNNIVNTFVTGRNIRKMNYFHYYSYILVKMLLPYFLKKTFDNSLFGMLYGDFERFCHDDEFPIKDVVPLFNFIIEGRKDRKIQFVSSDLHKRVLDLGNELVIRTANQNQRNRFWEGESQFSEFVIEYTNKESKLSSVQKSNAGFSNLQASTNCSALLTALRLFKQGIVGTGWMYEEKVYDVPIGGNSRRSFLPQQSGGPKYVIKLSELSKFKKFWLRYKLLLLKYDKFNKLNSTGKMDSIDLAISRFNSAYSRLTNQDKFIDFSIAMEALFSRKDIQDSLRHKLAIRFARFIEPKPDPIKREQKYNDFKKLYDQRSAIVHGGHIESLDLAMLEDYLRRCLLKYLDILIEDKHKEHESIIKELDFK